MSSISPKELSSALPRPDVRRLARRSVMTGLTPAALSRLLESAASGYAEDYLTLAEEMEERSPQYAAVLGMRKRAVMGLSRSVTSASDAQHDVALRDAVQQYLVDTPQLGRLIGALLDGLGKGYAVAEIDWDSSGKPWKPQGYRWCDPRGFRYNEAQTELLLANDWHTQTPLPPYRCIVHQPQLKMGLPLRGGLARMAAVTYLCAHYVQEDWLAFAEVFGMPVRIGRYGNAASDEDIELLKEAVTNLGSDAAAVLHESMRIEFASAAKGDGGTEMFERLADFFNKTLSKIVLGRSDAADSTAGQLGGQLISEEVRRDILEGDAEELQNTLNAQLVKPFIDLNWGAQPAYPTLRLELPDTKNLAGLADMLAKLVPLGLKVEQSVIRDLWGLPDPAPEAEILAPAQAQALNSHHTHAQALNRATTPPVEPVEPLADRLSSAAEPLLHTLLDPVQSALQDSADLMDFRERMLTLYPDLDGKAFAKLMGHALAAAEAAGYWEAQHGH